MFEPQPKELKDEEVLTLQDHTNEYLREVEKRRFSRENPSTTNQLFLESAQKIGINGIPIMRISDDFLIIFNLEGELELIEMDDSQQKEYDKVNVFTLPKIDIRSKLQGLGINYHTLDELSVVDLSDSTIGIAENKRNSSIFDWVVQLKSTSGGIETSTAAVEFLTALTRGLASRSDQDGAVIVLPGLVKGKKVLLVSASRSLGDVSRLDDEYDSDLPGKQVMDREIRRLVSDLLADFFHSATLDQKRRLIKAIKKDPELFNHVLRLSGVLSGYEKLAKKGSKKNPEGDELWKKSKDLLQKTASRRKVAILIDDANSDDEKKINKAIDLLGTLIGAMIDHAKLDLLLTDVQTKSNLEAPPPIPTYPELENEQFLKLVKILEKIFDDKGVKKEGARSDTWAKIFSLAQVALIGVNTALTAGTGARTLGKMADQYDWFQPDRSAEIQKEKAQYTSEDLLRILIDGEPSRIDNMWSFLSEQRNFKLKNEFMQKMLFLPQITIYPENVEWMKRRIVEELKTFNQEKKIYEGTELFLFSLREINGLDFYMELLRMANEGEIYLSVDDLLAINYLLLFGDIHPERMVDVLHTIYAYFPEDIPAYFSKEIILRILRLPKEQQEEFMKDLIELSLVRAFGNNEDLNSLYKGFGYWLGKEPPFSRTEGWEPDMDVFNTKMDILSMLDHQRETMVDSFELVDFKALSSALYFAIDNEDQFVAGQVLEIVIEGGEELLNGRSYNDLRDAKTTLELLQAFYADNPEAARLIEELLDDLWKLFLQTLPEN